MGLSYQFQPSSQLRFIYFLKPASAFSQACAEISPDAPEGGAFPATMAAPADVSADASRLPQRLFGFAGLIPDGFESRVIRLSPRGQRACQVSPRISVVLLTPGADSTARHRRTDRH